MPSPNDPFLDCLSAARARLDEIEAERRVIESLIRGLLQPSLAPSRSELKDDRRGKPRRRRHGRRQAANKMSV
jgi:hypothetical protein